MMVMMVVVKGRKRKKKVRRESLCVILRMEREAEEKHRLELSTFYDIPRN